MKLFGIIGNPLDHSLSPKLMNTFFKRQNLPYRYLPFRVEREHLKNLILCMKLVDVFGLNVTTPFKTEVLDFLDRLDASAKQCGAVNTIVRRKNQFIGFNTDGEGFCLALKKIKFDAENKIVAIIGCGGAARGIAASLAKRGAKEIHFFNRHVGKAKKTALFFKKQFPQTIWRAYSLETKTLQKTFSFTTLLVQATPASPVLPLKKLPATACVADIVYQPPKTTILKQAKRLKLKTLDGLDLLMSQASLNLKLWLHQFPDPKELRHLLRYQLGKKILL